MACPELPLHFAAYWNPLEELDPLAPRGMKLWAIVLERCPESSRFTWYGKLSLSGRLGLDPSEIPELNRAIGRQNEVSVQGGQAALLS